MWQKTWIAKSIVVNLLSRLPFHEKLHFWGQKLLGKHELDADEMFRRAGELYRLLHHVGDTARGRRVLEIGTGWFPFVPLMARLLGAERVVTVDIHPWLSLENVEDTVGALGVRLGDLAGISGAAEEELSREYCRLQKLLTRADDARDLMRRAGIEYLCPYDMTKNDFPDDSFDVAFSSNVLEHVPPETLRDIHRQTARVLDDRGWAIHRFNPGDHYKTFTGNPCNFLKFSERTWRMLGGHGLSYHNRLRSSDHARAARKTGLDIRLRANRVDEKAREAIERGELHLAPRFRGHSSSDLAATYTWLVLTPGELRDSQGFPVRGDTLEEILQQLNGEEGRRQKPVSAAHAGAGHTSMTTHTTAGKDNRRWKNQK